MASPGVIHKQFDGDEDSATLSELRAENARLRERLHELELRAEAREALEHFADCSAGWFWEMDASLRFTWFSGSVERMTGVPPSWHFGKTRAEVGTPQGIPNVLWEEHLASLERREPFKNFIFARQEDDGVRWMSTSGMPIYDAGEFKGYRGIATDVTTQIAARNSEQRLLDAIEAFDNLFALWDERDCLVVCNRRYREAFAPLRAQLVAGVSYEAHMRAAVEAGLFPQALGREEQWLADRLAAHAGWQRDCEVEFGDGRWFLVNDHKLADGHIASVAVDISSRKATEQELLDKNTLLETALEAIPDGVAVLDVDLSLVSWNDRLWQVLDLGPEQILADPEPGLALRCAMAGRGDFGEGEPEHLVASVEALARAGNPSQAETQLHNGNWIESRSTPIPGGGQISIYRDIDRRKKLEEELHKLATIDELTGLPNRRSIMRRLLYEVRRSNRHGSPCCVLMLDVDHFKQVNDNEGHRAGDIILVQLAQVIRKVVRDVDLVGRIGGEEFVVVVPGSSIAGAMVMAERLRETVNKLRAVVDSKHIPITISIGVAEARSGVEPAAVLKEADLALYDAKRSGRNRVCGFG